MIVTHNSQGRVVGVLDDLRREQGGLGLRVIVVDNASEDGTVEEVSAHSDIVLVEPGRNLGYAGGINAANGHLGDSRAVLVLNPDVQLREGSVHALWERLWRPGVGVTAPKILGADGELYRSLRFEPSLMRSMCDAVFGARLPTRPSWATETDFNDESYQYPHAIDWATGACLMIRREVSDILGAWNERFFLYSEETEYLRRVREAGWQVWFEPAAVIRHEGGASGQSPELAALLAVNRVRYAELHHGPAYVRGTRFAITVGALARLRRSAASRTAARYLLGSQSAWDELPSSRTSPPDLPASMPRQRQAGVSYTQGGAVIVPAHNEESLITSTLRPLSTLAAQGKIDLIVASNGSTDKTAGRAHEVAGAKVLELPTASKIGALNAADLATAKWPRLYLDADVSITPRAVQEVFAVLDDPGVMAARPPFTYDTSGASWPVRSYYRARGRLPMASQHLWGAGAYALSKKGRSRFGVFPDLVADDLFVDSLFTRDEKVVVETDPVLVRTPKNLPGLMAVLRRTYAGNSQLAKEVHSPRDGQSTVSTIQELITSARTPEALTDAVVYAALVTAARYQSRRTKVRWERDDSSRDVGAA